MNDFSRKFLIIVTFVACTVAFAGSTSAKKKKYTGVSEGVKDGKEYRYVALGIGTINEYGEMYFFLKELRKNYKPMTFDGDKEPSRIPTFEESTKTIFGIDSDKDGVRDEFEIYTNRVVKDKKARIAIKKLAKLRTKLFEMDEKGTDPKIMGKFMIDEIQLSEYCFEFSKKKLEFAVNDFVNIFYFDTALRSEIYGRIWTKVDRFGAKLPITSLEDLSTYYEKKCK